MYNRLYRDIDLDSRELTVPQLLARLPIISKTDLLSAPLEHRSNRRYGPSDVKEESTTGSTGQPFTLRIDRSYIRRRNMRFLRGLLSAGYRPWQRLMLLTDRHDGVTKAKLNRHYVSVEQSTLEILRAYQHIRPHILYGFLTPLRLLARNLSSKHHRPKLVISTAEMLCTRSRAQLETAFGCPVSDFYGLTEMGLVAWQRRAGERYIMPFDSLLTEFVADPTGTKRFRIIMTNLDLKSSPIIRFDTGDLARVVTSNGTPGVVAIEGRCIDTIVRRDGSELSPYRITDALRDVSGLRRFKVTQTAVEKIHVQLEVDADSRAGAEQNVRAVLKRLLGSDLIVTIQFQSGLVPDGSRKFRPVESRVKRP